MSEDRDEKLKQRLLKVCEQIRKAEHAVTDAQHDSMTENSYLRDSIEAASFELLQVAEKVEKMLS